MPPSFAYPGDALRVLRRCFRVLPGSSALALALLALAGCDERTASAEAPAAAQVEVAPVQLREIRAWDSFNGRIAAVDAVEIRPRVSGYITRIAFTEGAEVKRGDLLFVIDPRPYKATLESAQARLERARASRILAQAQHQRAQRLVQANAVSRDEAETRNASYLQSVADVNDAQAEVARAKLDLEFTEVRAPVAGRASRALLTLGNLVVADQSLLSSVVSQDPVYVYFDPDEHSWLGYQAGRASAEQMQVRIGLANDEGFPHEARVDFLDNQLDARTGTIRLRAVLANPDRRFTPGLYARVQLAGAASRQAVLIDDKAVLTDQDRKYVYLLGADSTAQRRDVVPGRMHEGLRVIDSGLAPGDEVIVGGLQRIYYPGAPVKASQAAVAEAR
ncbi:efflux RND transporter periplasmic adaptor subunit [Pseudomonas sp. NPDC089554]|uniref:efflux RND transporter periplasmic adaptor subunit n=1 Tax=Pseudomonas sp. NPDC089554 TaxID=3390653 RepID=UPI003D0631F6